jgi:hypothetical protein
MTKERKLHQLTGTIKGSYSGLVTNKKSPHKGRSFYILEIKEQNLFGPPSTKVIYAFYNLVSPKIWTILEQKNYQDKIYHFFCEKRVRGWRLKEMKEIENPN